MNDNDKLIRQAAESIAKINTYESTAEPNVNQVMYRALRLVWNSIDRVNHPAAEVVRAALHLADSSMPQQETPELREAL